MPRGLGSSRRARARSILAWFISLWQLQSLSYRRPARRYPTVTVPLLKPTSGGCSSDAGISSTRSERSSSRTASRLPSRPMGRAPTRIYQKTPRSPVASRTWQFSHRSIVFHWTPRSTLVSKRPIADGPIHHLDRHRLEFMDPDYKSTTKFYRSYRESLIKIPLTPSGSSTVSTSVRRR